MARTPTLVPILSAGRHRSPKHGACFMEFASFLAGERWSDHPACTHPLLAALARDVNDVTTDASRDRLMPLVSRVIGLHGDDPRIPSVIAMRAAAHALPVASLERQRALASGMLAMLDERPDEKLATLADSVFEHAPDAKRWARTYLDRVGIRHRNNERAAYAMVHTAVIGIALACIEDPDARLATLLTLAIEDVEAFIGTDQPQEQPALVLA